MTVYLLIAMHYLPCLILIAGIASGDVWSNGLDEDEEGYAPGGPTAVETPVPIKMDPPESYSPPDTARSTWCIRFSTLCTKNETIAPLSQGMYNNVWSMYLWVWL